MTIEPVPVPEPITFPVTFWIPDLEMKPVKEMLLCQGVVFSNILETVLLVTVLAFSYKQPVWKRIPWMKLPIVGGVPFPFSVHAVLPHNGAEPPI